ncbi:MAG: hypothetical protein ABGX04_14045 [Myxococcales bacterium]|nr:hypothetical protein [Myxococcales bacterium]
MRTRVWTIGLMGFFLCAGCGQQDSIVQSDAAMEQEIADAGEATHADVAVESVQVTQQKWRREGLTEDQEAVVQKAIEDGVYDANVGISVSGRAERDAYYEARERAAREFDIPAER